MGAHVLRIDRDAVKTARLRYRRAKQCQRIRAQRERAEIVRSRTTHAAGGDADRIGVAARRMRRVRRPCGEPHVAHIVAQVVRPGDEASATVEADAKVIRVERLGIVARRPVEVHEAQIAGRKGAGAGEPRHPVANTSVVNRPPQTPSDERPIEGEYLAPDKKPASGRNWRAKGGWLVGAGVLAAKFKGLLLVLLNFKYALYASKFALSAVSFIASIWFYTLFFGLKFAIVFVLLIAIHELGHVISFADSV
jgi:hypothetical protein